MGAAGGASAPGRMWGDGHSPTLTVLSSQFTDPADRGKAFGIYSAIALSGSVVDLIVGGVLTEYVDWRRCLYVNAVIALVTVLDGRLPDRAPRWHIDLPGPCWPAPG